MTSQFAYAKNIFQIKEINKTVDEKHLSSCNTWFSYKGV